MRPEALLSFHLRRRIRNALWPINPLLQRLRWGQPNPIEPWRVDEPFRALLREVEAHTAVDVVRLYMLFQFARACRHVAGDAAEVGVYRGGTARLLARVFEGSGKRLHLFDTFGGMPDVDPAEDWHQRGDFNDTSLPAVQQYLSDCGNVSFHCGLFPNTAAGLENSRFSFVHVDVDIHRSVLDACRFFYPRLEPGGSLLFDDYGFVSCPGARAAVDDYFADRAGQIIYLPTGQCVVSKQGSA